MRFASWITSGLLGRGRGRSRGGGRGRSRGGGRGRSRGCGSSRSRSGGLGFVFLGLKDALLGLGSREQLVGIVVRAGLTRPHLLVLLELVDRALHRLNRAETRHALRSQEQHAEVVVNLVERGILLRHPLELTP